MHLQRLAVGVLFALLALGGIARAESVMAVRHQGVERKVTVHRPAKLSNPAPLIVALHGLGQSVEGLQQWLHFDELADREGLVIAYPEAIDRRWSYGRPIKAPMPTVNGKTVDDVGFIREMIDGLVEL